MTEPDDDPDLSAWDSPHARDPNEPPEDGFCEDRDDPVTEGEPSDG